MTRKKQATAHLKLETVGKVLGTNAEGSLCPSAFRDAVFLAIDCEAYEFDQNKITEVGLATLDTRLIRNTPPGDHAAIWFQSMKYKHLRIEEYGHLVNRKFVKGDPDAFSFGESTWIKKKSAEQALTSIFNDPSGMPTEKESPRVKRKIVLVGHGLKNEYAYLATLGFNLEKAPGVVAIVDTQSFSGSRKYQLGLGNLCRAMGMKPQSLHNAGNDAAYTLQAMVLSCISYDSSPDAFRAAFRGPTKATDYSKLPRDGDATHGSTSRWPNANLEQRTSTSSFGGLQGISSAKEPSHLAPALLVSEAMSDPRGPPVADDSAKLNGLQQGMPAPPESRTEKKARVREAKQREEEKAAIREAKKAKDPIRYARKLARREQKRARHEARNRAKGEVEGVEHQAQIGAEGDDATQRTAAKKAKEARKIAKAFRRQKRAGKGAAGE